ncbi:MAG: response regulator, partial [Blautia wexlerae]
MEQYKVSLVDDEVEVIDVMKKKIRWNDLGFDVVGSATNGVKALELVEKLQPDVVLTDIKMPYMDGLELARKLNQDYPNIYIMLCTGFDEFEYAKEAVHLEIKEYMLKPISATELSESLMKLKATLDREREEKLNVKKLEDYFQEVLPKLQSNFFISLIEGRVREEDYERFLLDYRVDMKGPLFCCMIFHTSENDVPDGMNPLLLSMSVEREIKQRLTENCNCQEFIYMGNT